MGEGVQEGPGRSRMVECWAGPEEAVLGVDPLVGDAEVVGGAAPAGRAQFLEDLPRLGAPVVAQPRGQPLDDPQVAPYPGGSGYGLVAEPDPALQVRHGAALLGPLRSEER